MPEVRKYLPDFDEKPERRLNREFVFGIVNTLDPTFFARVQSELSLRAAKAKPVVNKVESLQVQPELLKILQDAKKAHPSR